MIASRLSILYIFLITLISYNLHAHEVSLIYGDFKKTEDSWSLEIELDATLTVPELRENRDAPQPSREWLYEQSNEQYQAMREEAARFFKDFLVFKHGNETQEYTITFPNFDKSPPEFSKLQNEGAYLKVILNGNISADQFGNFSAYVASGNDLPTMTIAIESLDALYPIPPGSNEVLFSTSGEGVVEGNNGARWSYTGFINLGFRHVIPDGLDHILFILALFLMARKWKPLLKQSVVFTVAHSLTLGLCISGVITEEHLGGVVIGWIELLIALSIVYLALENIFKKNASPVRLGAIFIFGLIHGLGFASSLSESFQQSDAWLMPLIVSTVGIEIAQVCVLAAAWVCTIWIARSDKYYGMLRLVCSIAIAACAFWMMTQRVSF